MFNYFILKVGFSHCIIGKFLKLPPAQCIIISWNNPQLNCNCYKLFKEMFILYISSHEMSFVSNIRVICLFSISMFSIC